MLRNVCGLTISRGDFVTGIYNYFMEANETEINYII